MTDEGGASNRDELLIEAGMALASDLSLDRLLQHIVDVAAEVIGARYAALGVLGNDGRIEEFVTHGVSPEQREAIGPPPVGKGLLGALIEDARPIRVDEIGDDPRSSGFPEHHPPMRSFMGAPVMARGRVFGNIYLTEKIGASAFSGADEHALVVLAAQAGLAVENARLLEETRRRERQLAVLADRERIAKELHDGVIQSLFGVGMGVQGAAALAADPAVAARLDDAVGEIDHVIRDLRSYIFGLRPGILADRRLDQALRELADEFAERSGVITVVEIDERVAAELGSRAGDLVQIAREALSNVGRHADATTCRVSLRRHGTVAVLEVDDDGRGFDGQPARPGGQGVTNLHERAAALGGASRITGVPGEGTTVRIEVPLT